MADHNPNDIPVLRHREAGAASTPRQMMALLEVQALSLSMNNAANAQQNAYTLNTAVIGSICKRIMEAGQLRGQPVSGL